MAQQENTPTVPPAQANIVPTAPTDGIVYANQVPLTSSEVDLWGGAGASGYDPVPVEFGAAIIASVTIATNGSTTVTLAYVVMQQDMGDGNWMDINWAFFSQLTGKATYIFTNGVAGANVFQQTRAQGNAPSPQASGSNQVVLGGRIRFTGQLLSSSGGTGSSGSPGQNTNVTATVRYKILPLN